MSRKKRDKKRKRRKKIRALFISFIFIYLIFRSVPVLHASTLKTTIVEEGTLEDKVSLKGIIVKDEAVYSAEGSGKLKLYKKEGERVKVGTQIAQISSLTEDSSLKKKLKEVDKKLKCIEEIRREKETVKSDKDKVTKDANEVLDEIQNNIIYEDYEEVLDLKEQLYLSLEKQRTLSGDNTLAAQTLQKLKKQREDLIKQIANSTLNCISKEAGIVSYNIDGLENIYSAKNILNYNVDDVEQIEEDKKTVKSGKEVNAKDKIFKIIDNHEWYLLLKVDDFKTISPLQEGDNVGVVIDDNEQKLKGNIIKINKKGRQALMVIKFNFFCHDYYDKRKVDVELIKFSHEGFKIPIKSICKKDGIEGVYIKDISGIIKFKPIKILGKNEKYAIISSGDKNNNIKINENEEAVKTVKIFDEILLTNGKKVKEGRIVE